MQRDGHCEFLQFGCAAFGWGRRRRRRSRRWRGRSGLRDRSSKIEPKAWAKGQQDGEDWFHKCIYYLTTLKSFWAHDKSHVFSSDTARAEATLARRRRAQRRRSGQGPAPKRSSSRYHVCQGLEEKRARAVGRDRARG